MPGILAACAPHSHLSVWFALALSDSWTHVLSAPGNGGGKRVPSPFLPSWDLIVSPILSWGHTSPGWALRLPLPFLPLQSQKPQGLQHDGFLFTHTLPCNGESPYDTTLSYPLPLLTVSSSQGKFTSLGKACQPSGQCNLDPH